MEIIDTHAHVYDVISGMIDQIPMNSLDYGKVTIGDEVRRILPPSFQNSASTAELLLEYMDWGNVERAVMMANPYYGFHNEYIEKCSKKYSDRLIGIALVDVLQGKKAADELENIYKKGVLKGMAFETKSTFQMEPERRMADTMLEPLWECIAAYKQPVFIHMFRNEDIEDVELLSSRYPEITFTLCHIGADACLGKEARENNLEKVFEIVSKHQNVYIDTSSVPDYFPEEYPFKESIKILEKAWRKVGPEKLMWATDYPGMLTKATYKQLIDLILNGCKNIPFAHKEMIMGKNAAELFFNRINN